MTFLLEEHLADPVSTVAISKLTVIEARSPPNTKGIPQAPKANVYDLWLSDGSGKMGCSDAVGFGVKEQEKYHRGCISRALIARSFMVHNIPHS